MLTPTTGQQLATPTIDGGQRVLSSNVPISQSAAVTTGIDISSTNLISFTATRFGTLTSDCSLVLQLSIDGGLNYRDHKTYANAEINIANGMSRTEQIKGTHIRFLLIPGTMTGANGLNVRALV